MYNHFQRVKLQQIDPQGWIKKFLVRQKEGLTGHLDEIGYPYNIDFWQDKRDGDNLPPWEVFEQTAYWIDGMYSCGVLLNDDFLIEKAAKNFTYTLSHIAKDGFLGPEPLREKSGWHRWPHVVYFRAMIKYYNQTSDERVIKALSDFYLNSQYDYSTKRESMHIEIMLWLYGETKDERLKDLAEKTYQKYNQNSLDDNNEAFMFSSKKPYSHGVTYDETGKIGAILYLYTGNERYLQAAVKAFEKIDRFFELADGGHSSNEFMLGRDSLQSHETCTITDYTWALSYFLMATGDAKYADKIEKCVFNAGIGSVTKDFTAFQYFSCPNQVIVTNNSNHNLFFRGGGWMQYKVNHHTACCAGNVNRFMPNYCQNMWMQKGSAVFKTLYGSSAFSFDVDGKTVKITEETKYPFEDKISFTIENADSADFSLHLRVPQWCKNPELFVNGTSLSLKNKSGFVSVNGLKNGDTVCLHLPSEIKLVQRNFNEITVEKGALVYSLPIKTEMVSVGRAGRFSDYDMNPLSNWNYAINLTEVNKEILKVENDSEDYPWDLDGNPCRLKIPVHRLKNWKIRNVRKVKACVDLYAKRYVEINGKFQFTPKISKNFTDKNLGEKEYVELVPIGCTQLRIAVFPQYEEKELK